MLIDRKRVEDMRSLATICATIILCSSAMTATADHHEPIASWNFNEGEGRTVVDDATGTRDTIENHFWHREGVAGSGLKMDGFTTIIQRDGEDSPRLGDNFTIEAWVAPQAYPWNWCAIVNQELGKRRGYFFGIDALGHVGLHMAVNHQWVECNTEATIPFMTEWSHIAATFRSDGGLTVYINGEVAAIKPSVGRATHAPGAPFLIGRNITALPADALVRDWLPITASYSYDGIIDELKMYDRALSAKEIKASYKALKPTDAPALEWRKLPQLPEGTHPFGARYANLEFYPEWDQLWRTGDHADIVVLFDEIPGKMVFWRGTNYNENLVTENGRWVGDQSAETGANWELEHGPASDHATGCCEHMSDKQNRFAHVRIIESNDARVVVHWRYALVDIQYKISNTDPITNWGDWADEYYYIYPDGVSVRAAIIRGIADEYSLTEPATFNQPGEKAEDNVEIGAVTVATMDERVTTYRWEPWPDMEADDANMCIVNFKSKFKPFYIFEPGASIGPYGAPSETRPDYSAFPTWNHWPVGQAPSDGRYALAPDRVSSSAILSPGAGMSREEEGGPLRARFIMGLTDQSIEELFPLRKSWLNPPSIDVNSGFTSEGYSRDQRAFLITQANAKAGALSLSIDASEDSPLVNPAFVIANWTGGTPEVTINGEELRQGKELRIGRHMTLESSDLIIYLKRTETNDTTITITP
jgi:hypothetical protein